MQSVGIFPRACLAAIAVTGLLALLFCASAGAATSCDRVASTSGSDGNAGTADSPYRSAQRLADSLGYGQTGCLRAGTFAGDNGIEVTRPGITLTSYPGERATLRGELKIEKGADRVTVSDLNIDGRSSYNIGPMVFAADTTFDNVDVTNYHTGICFILGANDPAYGRAQHTVIENSSIHDCGRLPAQNGDHGIYVEHSDGAIIRNNWIYDNADRGIQLYPDSQGSKVYGNVIDGNGEGVIFSGGDDSASSNNQVYDNVISNSKVRWNVESYWSDGLVGSGNVVHDNCIWASNSGSQSSYYNSNGGILPRNWGGDGYSAYKNVVARPQFVNATAGDFALQPDSPCANGQAAAVTLQTDTKRVQAGSSVRLHGHAAAANQVQVKIQILRHGHWKKFARTRLRANRKFTVRRRLGAHLATGRARLRAEVPRLGRSRPVAIRVKS
jgi:parallel beta-helix repeat protein